MRLRTFDFAAVFVNLVHFAYSDHILSCNVTSIEPCPGENQECSEVTQRCECVRGFTMVDDHCKPGDVAPPSSHATTVVLVTLFTLALVVGGLALVIRKYNLVEYVRQKINMRRRNDVMYEDVMIGQDDPPLSP